MGMGGTTTYAYVYAKIRAMSSTLLHLAEYEQLLGTSTPEEFLRMLAMTGYEEIVNELFSIDKVPSLRQFDHALTKKMTHQMRKLITSAVPPQVRDFISMYLDKYYYESLKAIIDAQLARIPASEVRPFILVAKPEQEEKLYQLLEVDSIAPILDSMPDELQTNLSFLQETDQLSDQLIPKVDSSIDKYFYRRVWARSSQLSGHDRTAVKKILGLEIDLKNIETILRTKILNVPSDQIEEMLIPIYYRIKSIVPTMIGMRSAQEVLNLLHDTAYQEVTDRIREHYERTKGLKGFQRRIKEFYLVQVLRSMRGNAFHAGLLMGFLAIKENEIRNLRILYEGIIEGLSKDFLREQIIPI